MAKPIIKGLAGVIESPNSPLFENTKEGPRFTRIFSGVYAAVYESAPNRLAQMAGTPAAFLVDSVRVEKAPGGRGILTVVLAPAPVQDYTMAGNVVYEVEWIETQKRMEEHPVFNSTSGSGYPNAGLYLLTDSDRDSIEAWRNMPGASQRSSAYASLSAHAKAFAARIRRGQESYVVYSPLCRQTRKYATKPDLTRCGTRQDPPAAVKVSGYSYLKTADRATRDRTWTRIEEWTGAHYIDDVIYPT